MPQLSKLKKYKSPLEVRKRIESVLEDTTNFTKNVCENSKSGSLKKTLFHKDDENTSLSKSLPKKTELSQHMNDPAVKEAYETFLNDLSQASSSKSHQNRCSSRLDALISEPSLEETVKELENDQLNSSLSQDILNIKDNKEAYKKHMKNNFMLDDFDFIDFHDKEKKIKSISTSKSLHHEKNDKIRNKPVSKDKEENKVKSFKSLQKLQNKREKPIKNQNQNTKIYKENKVKSTNMLQNKRKELNIKQNRMVCKEDKVKSKKKLHNKEEMLINQEPTEICNKISLYKKMTLIHESRNVGLYVFCDKCDKARYLPDVKDPLELPEKWYCHMNPDQKHNTCTDPEEITEDEEFLIKNLYNAGSIVWGRVEGYPWWPAMIEDDPDIEDYFWLEENIEQPTYYNVTFFDSRKVTRAWLRPNAIVPYKNNMKNHMYVPSKDSKYYNRIKFAMEHAEIAIELPLIDRLIKYSFINRYNGPLKKRELKKKGSEKRDKMIKYNDNNKARNKKLEKGEIKEHKKRGNDKVDKKEKKTFKRICTVSTISNEDNISILLEGMAWDNPEKLDLDFMNLM